MTPQLRDEGKKTLRITHPAVDEEQYLAAWVRITGSVHQF
jgi:hypothetical protein